MKMLDFLFGILFALDLLIAGFVITMTVPRRDRFILRLAVSLVVCIAGVYGWNSLMNAVGDMMHIVLRTTVSFAGTSVFVMLVLYACFRLDGWSALFFGASCWFVQYLGNQLDQCIPYEHLMSWECMGVHFLIMTITAFVIWLLIFQRVDAAVLRRIPLAFAGPVWLIMCIACVLLNALANYRGESGLVIKLFGVLCVIMGLLYQNTVYQLCGARREEETFRGIMEQSRRQYRATKDQVELINIKAHDLKHQIHAFRRNGQIDEKTLREMEQTVDGYDMVVKTGNTALDVILTEKSAACFNKGIGFTCMAQGDDLYYLEPSDLYALFGNALDNAIEATEQLSDPEKKQIAFTVNRRKDFYVVSVQNYVEGKVIIEDGMPKTTKSDTLNHGYGMKSMTMLAEKYGGSVSFHTEGDMAELNILLPCRSE